MTKPSTTKPIPPCGCERCLCRRGPRCRCHVYPPPAAPKATRDCNALLALALWDYGRTLRRRKSVN